MSSEQAEIKSKIEKGKACSGVESGADSDIGVLEKILYGEKTIYELLSLGLLPNDVITYMALAEMGTASYSDMARLMSSENSSVNCTLDRLVGYGLAEKSKLKPEDRENYSPYAYFTALELDSVIAGVENHPAVARRKAGMEKEKKESGLSDEAYLKNKFEETKEELRKLIESRSLSGEEAYKESVRKRYLIYSVINRFVRGYKSETASLYRAKNIKNILKKFGVKINWAELDEEIMDTKIFKSDRRKVNKMIYVVKKSDWEEFVKDYMKDLIIVRL
jgi:hypothetical protein